MTVYVIETQLVFDGKPVAGVWELSAVHATAAGAAKAVDQMARVFLALDKAIFVRTRELQVQP